MATFNITNLLSSATKFDMMVNFPTSTSNGWKLSIQGKSIEDASFLFERLEGFLSSNSIPFKVGTAKRFSHENKEQSKKAMTIYVPNSFNHLELAEEVYSLILDYKGWQDIKTPSSYSHYAGGIFFRNDRDESGQYIPAN